MANIQKIDSEVSDFIGFLHNATEVKPLFGGHLFNYS